MNYLLNKKFIYTVSIFHEIKNFMKLKKIYIYRILYICSVRTPGGKLVYQYLKKPKKIPRCGQCKDKLRGIQPARPMERSRMCRRKKTVKRVYGGVLCHKCVKERYIFISFFSKKTIATVQIYFYEFFIIGSFALSLSRNKKSL